MPQAVYAINESQPLYENKEIQAAIRKYFDKYPLKKSDIDELLHLKGLLLRIYSKIQFIFQTKRPQMVIQTKRPQMVIQTKRPQMGNNKKNLLMKNQKQNDPKAESALL